MRVTWVLFLVTCWSTTSANIPECAVSTFGSEYRGHVTNTVTGKTCQRWDVQTPHSHNYNTSAQFPDRNIGLAENYCRNPVQVDTGGIWCYTTDPAVRWEYCDIPKCHVFPECKRDDIGADYRGSLSITVNNNTCLPWDLETQTQRYCHGNHCHNKKMTSKFSALDSNYCRNPDSKMGGPWCYIGDGTEWEYCDVPYCKPSASCTTTPGGAEYVGTISTTSRGRHCQRWDDVVPHKSNYTSDADFPDASVADAANYCRNPAGDKAGVWCYTIDPALEWDYCDVERCPDCKLTEEGAGYAGTVSMTTSGYTCQRWDAQSPHEHNMTDMDMFPDVDFSTSGNYCRNPDGRRNGPWCYTTDPGVEWDTCDLAMCTAKNSSQLPRGVKHVVHIGIDGLHPCFVDAPAPNLMSRLSNQGAWTLKGRTVIETWSAPCWTGILCSSPPETSGVVNNSWIPPWNGFSQPITPSTGKDVPFPCIFDMLKKQNANVRTASFYVWDWLQYLMSTGLAGRMDHELYCREELPLAVDCDNYTTGNMSEYLKDVFVSAESSYTFGYLMSVDEAGHNYGWCNMTPKYFELVRFVDQHVGTLLDVIEEAGMKDEVMVVVSSDHGGLGYGHGEFRDEDLIVPIFMSGPGIKADYQMKHEVRNIDLMPTVLYAMGYKPSPWWKGHILHQIFEGN